MLAPSVLGSAHDIIATASAPSAKYTIREFCWEDDISGLPRKQGSYPRDRAGKRAVCTLCGRADPRDSKSCVRIEESSRFGVPVFGGGESDPPGEQRCDVRHRGEIDEEIPDELADGARGGRVQAERAANRERDRDREPHEQQRQTDAQHSQLAA